ncbi:hypothetical protein ACFL2C_04045 [Patescibacteria group bacterium]
MKKQSALTVFYVAYFFWLFMIVFLSRAKDILGYFVILVLIFYFVFLRDKWDLLVFFATVSAYYLYRVVTITFDTISYDLELIPEIPLWIPLSWGTTIIALKKFYSIASKRIQ